MRKNNFFSIQEIESMFPSERRMIQDAQSTYPRHPMYKDINKKYREGYIRGQIDLIRSMKEKMKVLRHNRHKIHIKIYEPTEETSSYKDILRDNELSDLQKIARLEAELDGTLDFIIHNAIRTQIDLLEDRVSMNQNLKKKQKQYKEVEFL